MKKRACIKRPKVLEGIPLKNLAYPQRLMYMKWSKRNAPLKTLLTEMYRDIEGLLLGRTLSVDILNSKTGEIIIPSHRKISRIILRKLFYFHDSIELDPSPIRSELLEIITSFQIRFSEMETKEEEAADVYVREYGKQWRRMIEDSLKFLDEHEPTWNLDRPIGRKTYIRELIKKAKRSAKT